MQSREGQFVLSVTRP
nr:unnamed protein product [Callosobruchus chinensis]